MIRFSIFLRDLSILVLDYQLQEIFLQNFSKTVWQFSYSSLDQLFSYAST